MLRIRILKPMASRRFGTLLVGDAVCVPAIYASAWISAGLAEQDKMLDGPSETK